MYAKVRNRKVTNLMIIHNFASVLNDNYFCTTIFFTKTEFYYGLEREQRNGDGNDDSNTNTRNKCINSHFSRHPNISMQTEILNHFTFLNFDIFIHYDDDLI